MVVQSKHFLNTPPSLVVDSLRGLCALNPQIALDEANKVVHIASPNRSKVALVCGGGSGHEPAHPGFVGEGMLTAAVCGNVFASPSASQVRQAINLVDNDKGTLIVVKNYTGDILNFGLAKEHYAAAHPEKADKVKFVIVADDVAVGKTQGSIVGRRGLAGTCLVYKIAGALAHRGASLDEVYNTAQYVTSRLGTIGVGLEHCHVPGTAVPESHLGAQELEIGLGIHNESGFRRVSPVPPLNELIPSLLEMIISTSDAERSFVPFKGGRQDRVVLLVNNLGGLSALELGAVTGETTRALGASGIKVERVLSGSFMSSLNMPGFSITLLLLPGASETSAPSSDLILSLLDQETSTPGWVWSSKAQPSAVAATSRVALASDSNKSDTKLKAENPTIFNQALKKACEALVAAEPEITRMDSIAGDGDCGLTLKAGASAVLKKLEEGVITGEDVVGSAITIADVAENNMGGTSGALYSIFFSALAQNLITSASGSEATSATWEKALRGALDRLYTYTRARPPSRTLVDPLAAFVSNLSQGFTFAVKAAGSAAEETANLAAKAGRSAYVEGERLRAEKIPDPGAWGVKVVLEAL
ncbi:dihydroxyacetone kinase [Coniophora puteana RWD-64-598 SS2]|uniref:Dihydroxyacetone kinase n=1 Tax=Coniophora puteana (strain RWD-64-598) TaxID=741705 RepID=A0A5M3MKG8_CONPW|nr:dihydroxyacetone kinase [Coniophora puteana RWD-64-598 SS2]EIW79314.1 dihydroxyacetone kinase [Coniophora puteana RWD-64-598 SS2]